MTFDTVKRQYSINIKLIIGKYIFSKKYSIIIYELFKIKNTIIWSFFKNYHREHTIKQINTIVLYAL